MRVLIVGCGYVGLPLGSQLAGQGHRVFGLRRSKAHDEVMTRMGLTPLHADLSQGEELSKLPAEWDWVVNTVSSGRGGEEAYRAAYLLGTQNLLRWLEPAPPKRMVYTSSTSVYGQTDGSLVKEDDAAAGGDALAEILLEAEGLLLSAARERKFPAVILRLSGIYGPDRTYFLRRFLDGEVRLLDGGRRMMNMVHRDDVVGAVLAALEHGRPGEVYNVSDDEPVSELHFYHWLAETLLRSVPPRVSSADSEAEQPKRRRTSKRVCNRKLKMELGYCFKHPTFREGYTAEMARLDEAGLLESAT